MGKGAAGCCAKLLGDKKREGPRGYEERGCQDFLCLLLFIGFWIGMIVIMSISISAGDPNAIRYGADYMGNRCGVGDFSGKPVCFYPRMHDDIIEQTPKLANPQDIKLYGLCMKECPGKDNIGDKIEDYGTDDKGRKSDEWIVGIQTKALMNRCIPYEEKDSTENLYCSQPACDPTTYDYHVCYAGEFDQIVSDPDNRLATYWRVNAMGTEVTDDQKEKCETTVNFNLEQTVAAGEVGPVASAIASTAADVASFVDAIEQAKTEILLMGILCPVLFGFAWIILLRLFARTLVYLSILMMGILLAVGTAICFAKAGMAPDSVNSSLNNAASAAGSSNTMDAAMATDAEDVWFYEVMGYVLAIVTVVFLIAIVYYRNEINVTVSLVRTSTRVIQSVPGIVVFPFLTVTAIVLVFLQFVLVMGYIITAKPETYEDYMKKINDSTSVDVNTNSGQKVSLVYHLFGFLWTTNWLLAIGTCVLASITSNWYFFREHKDADPNTYRFKMYYGVKVVVRYHLGSLAFGSFIIAVIQLIRIALEYIDQKTQQMQEGSFALRVVMKCMKCCFYCLEKSIKYITFYAYIYIAINGNSFCSACFQTFGLLGTYAAQAAVCTGIVTVLGILSSIIIPMASSLLFYAVASGAGLKNPLYGCVIVFMMAYFIARAFGQVYETITQTLFLSAFLDKDEYGGKYMSPELRDALGMDPSSIASNGDDKKGADKGADKGAAAEAPPPDNGGDGA